MAREQGVGANPLQEAVRLQGEWVREEVATLRRERRGRILVMSSWGSGSSFVGGLLDSHPGGMVPVCYIHPKELCMSMSHFKNSEQS